MNAALIADKAMNKVVHTAHKAKVPVVADNDIGKVTTFTADKAMCKITL